MVHPLDCRRYNSFYDEWDLWFPSSWETVQDDSSEVRTGDSDADTVLDESLSACPAPTTTSATKQPQTSELLLATTFDDSDDLLNPCQKTARTKASRSSRISTSARGSASQ